MLERNCSTKLYQALEKTDNKSIIIVPNSKKHDLLTEAPGPCACQNFPGLVSCHRATL